MQAGGNVAWVYTKHRRCAQRDSQRLASAPGAPTGVDAGVLTPGSWASFPSDRIAEAPDALAGRHSPAGLEIMAGPVAGSRYFSDTSGSGHADHGAAGSALPKRRLECNLA